MGPEEFQAAAEEMESDRAWDNDKARDANYLYRRTRDGMFVPDKPICVICSGGVAYVRHLLEAAGGCVGASHSTLTGRGPGSCYLYSSVLPWRRRSPPRKGSTGGAAVLGPPLPPEGGGWCISIPAPTIVAGAPSRAAYPSHRYQVSQQDEAR